MEFYNTLLLVEVHVSSHALMESLVASITLDTSTEAQY
jgi:hypothetical protein